MNEKGAIKSVGVLGGAIAILPAVDAALTALGLLPSGVLTEGMTIIASAVGGLLSIWGRIRASTKIKGLF
jgi:hypothetical protein